MRCSFIHPYYCSKEDATKVEKSAYKYKRAVQPWALYL